MAVQGSLVLTLGIQKNMLTLEVVQANNLPNRPNGPPPGSFLFNIVTILGYLLVILDLHPNFYFLLLSAYSFSP